MREHRLGSVRTTLEFLLCFHPNLHTPVDVERRVPLWDLPPVSHVRAERATQQELAFEQRACDD